MISLSGIFTEPSCEFKGKRDERLFKPQGSHPTETKCKYSWFLPNASVGLLGGKEMFVGMWADYPSPAPHTSPSPVGQWHAENENLKDTSVP